MHATIQSKCCKAGGDFGQRPVNICACRREGTINTTTIVTLITYTFWADMRVLQACLRITPAEFIQSVSPDPGWHSLRGTLVHSLDTAYGWRKALTGSDDGGVLDERNFGDVASLTARWQLEQTAWLEYVARLRETDINSVWWQHEQSQRTRWQTIMHVVNEMTHHRSEAATILTGLGHSPGELDFDLFVVDVYTM